MQTRTPAASAAIVLCAFAAPAALAQSFTTFGDESAFLSAAGDVMLEDFNDEPLVPRMDGGTIDADGFTITSDAARIGLLPGTTFGNADGTPFFDGFVTTDPGETITFTFDAPVTSFGGTFTGPSSGAGVGLFVDGTRVLSSLDFVTGSANSFLGFTSDTPFTSLTLDRSGDTATFGEIFGLDNVFFGVVPEPATAGLLGVAGLALLRRRRA